MPLINAHFLEHNLLCIILQCSHEVTQLLTSLDRHLQGQSGTEMILISLPHRGSANGHLKLCKRASSNSISVA